MHRNNIIWRLRSGSDRRFRTGHPWVYSNELEQSPKGIEPGAAIELQDSAEKFLARGFGNPHSLIAFRAMSRDPKETHPISPEGILRRLKAAADLRKQLGLASASHRLCFGEADHLPGLIIDQYKIAQSEATWVWVIQAHTAGMDRFKESWEQYVQLDPNLQTAVILNNNVSARKLEGLEQEAPHILKPLAHIDLANTSIVVAGANSNMSLQFYVNLIDGQKTGFFLDQAANVRLAIQTWLPVFQKQTTPIRILDLCCYVGQWGAQLSRAFQDIGKEVEVLAVDASSAALTLAQQNIQAQGAQCQTLKSNVLKDLDTLPSQSFDIVISDPPALIKNRKDLHAGIHAYLQLHTQVMRLTRKAMICCSCSGLLSEEDFLRTLTKAAHRNGTSVRWISRGCQSPDHPMLSEFPEGRYLKTWMGLLGT